MFRLSSLLHHEIILILFWKLASLISGYVPFEKQEMVSNYQCTAFVSVIYYLFQTKCLFLNVHCQSLLQLFLFEIPKGSLGLIFAVRTQIMRTRTWRCVQSSNKWTSKDSAFQLQQAFMPIKWLILQEFKHCSILIFNLGCILGLKTQAATKVWKQWDSVKGFNKSSCWAPRSASDSERKADHNEGNCQWQAVRHPCHWGRLGLISVAH